MGRAATALLVLVFIGVPPPLAAAARTATAPPPSPRRGDAVAAPAPSKHPGHRRAHAARRSLVDAEEAMRALLRDRVKRRYRHHWERAIAGLVRAARGRDAPAALLDAARARYALYRWSANEADREEALRFAAKASRLGSREAPAFAAAIRREAGDDRPTRRAAPKGPPPRAEPAEEEAAPDPALEATVADLRETAEAPHLALGESGGDGAARVSEVRTWASPEYTRIAVYLSHWVGWQKLELAPDAEHPRRLALDFRPALLAGKALARPVEGRQVDRVRAAQNDAETVRVVLDLPGDHAVRAFGLDDPPRLVVDVGTVRAPASSTSTSTSTSTSDPTATPTPTPTESQTATASSAAGEEGVSAAAIRRIVVDAGHGGHDPGAIGPSRVREKDVTLAIARRLARRLQTEGFEVVLTRKDDRYLALEERTALANTARGDLFVSVHANANPRRTRAGVETYFLDVTNDRYAARLAARENGADLDAGSGGEVGRILTDLDAKASAGASRRLAALVQQEVCAAVRGHIGEVRDLGVKSALFYVLLGARMPAVLVETAFISNRAEERRLASSRYQEEVAQAIARAVRGFARREIHLVAAGRP